MKEEFVITRFMILYKAKNITKTKYTTKVLKESDTKKLSVYQITIKANKPYHELHYKRIKMKIVYNT